jgi:hypothetical protein
MFGTRSRMPIEGSGDRPCTVVVAHRPGVACGARLLAALVATGLACPQPASAHGLGSLTDPPIPWWVAAWGASLALAVSFLALAALWRQPQLTDERWRPLPFGLGRLLGSRVVDVAAGALGVFLLFVVIWSGLAGEQSPSGNFAPTFVYVVFWVGLVPASVLFGDVFHAVNPWRALARLASWAGRGAGLEAPPASRYPDRLGRLPAALGLLVFAWLELIATDGALPRNVALAACVYTAITLVAMLVFGIEPWLERGEAFGVYFNLFSRLAPFSTRDRIVGIRRPLSGFSRLEPLPGTGVLVAVMLGTVTFDGIQESELWRRIDVRVFDLLQAIGVPSSFIGELASTIELLGCVGAIYGLYALGARLAGTHGASNAHAHSLVPIALAYVLAHYFTYLVTQGYTATALASDPLARGWDLFGTATNTFNPAVLTATVIWVTQIAFVLSGHITGLVLAHDRALELHGESAAAARSQRAMLVVMVVLTTLALWLLTGGNA